MEERKHNEYYGEYRSFLDLLGEDNSAQQQALRRRLHRAIREELTPRQLQLVTMYYSDNMMLREIAQELGISVSTVSRTLSRARARLRRCLRYGARELLK